MTTAFCEMIAVVSGRYQYLKKLSLVLHSLCEANVEAVHAVAL